MSQRGRHFICMGNLFFLDVVVKSFVCILLPSSPKSFP